ncbi:MAG: hypothetical protein ACRDXB_11845, partial [Actinomycetes bacterium]
PERDPVSRDAHENVDRIGEVLASNRLGHPFREEPVPWPELEADLRAFIALDPSDYLHKARVLPDLLERLYTTHATDPAHRRDALVGLLGAGLNKSVTLLKNFGAPVLAQLAAVHMRYAAEDLDDAAWVGVAEWRTAQAFSGNRARMLTISRRAADQLESDDDPRARQVYGMHHLNASMASVALRRPDDAQAHLDEAREVAEAVNDAPMFANLNFNKSNWGVWRVSVGVELGEGPKVAELARSIDLSVLQTDRLGVLYGDTARGLAQDRRTRDKAAAMMLHAERIAPQLVRTNPMMRETVGDLMRRAKRTAGGRALRGMAYRMGLAA